MQSAFNLGIADSKRKQKMNFNNAAREDTTLSTCRSTTFTEHPRVFQMALRCGGIPPKEGELKLLLRGFYYRVVET